MATYTKVYNKPYPDGYKDGKDSGTPVTADILNNQSEAFEAIEQYLEDNPIEQVGSGTTDYKDLSNKPKINGVELDGNLSSSDLGITGGGGTGTSDYNDLDNKPSIENVALTGNKTLSDFGGKKQIEIDYSDYMLLSEEERNDTNVVYLVKNFPDNVITASNIAFDSSDSELVSEDINSAILEVNTKADESQNTLGYSAKNKLPYPYYETTHVDSGIEWNDNGDGTVTANKTATANSSFYCKSRSSEKKYNLPVGKYILSGCPSGGSSSTYELQLGRSNESGAYVDIGREYGSGFEFEITKDTAELPLQVLMQIKSGVTVDNLVFKPMIRLANNKDDSYKPYAPDVKSFMQKPFDVITIPYDGALGVTTSGTTASFQNAVPNGYNFAGAWFMPSVGSINVAEYSYNEDTNTLSAKVVGSSATMVQVTVTANILVIREV